MLGDLAARLVPFSLTYMKMREVPLMFHRAFRDSTKHIGFSEFGGTIAYPFLLTPQDSECACAYNNILRISCGTVFPAMDATNPFISRSNGLARTSDELRPALSAMSSMGRGSSELSSPSIIPSPGER